MASEATLLEQGDVAAPKGANQMEHLCRNCGVSAIGASLATHTDRISRTHQYRRDLLDVRHVMRGGSPGIEHRDFFLGMPTVRRANPRI